MEFLHDYKKETFNLDKINKFAAENPAKLIFDAEKHYREQMSKIASEIASNGNYKIILMAGPSSSGKTTSSNIIRDRLSELGYESIVVSMDDFFLNRDQTPKLPNGDYDFENVTALDLEYLNKFIQDMFDKGEALMPQFNFKTGNREPEYKKIVLNYNTIVIIEGIHALNPIVFKSHQENMYRIYISVNSNFESDNELAIPAQKLRLMRRLIRDYRTRGMTISHTLKIWQNVLDGEDMYIKPYKNTANFLINSAHAFEPLMYADKLLPLLKEDSSVPLALELIAMLEKCNTLSPTLLPEDSLLHEFLG